MRKEVMERVKCVSHLHAGMLCGHALMFMGQLEVTGTIGKLGLEQSFAKRDHVHCLPEIFSLDQMIS